MLLTTLRPYECAVPLITCRKPDENRRHAVLRILTRCAHRSAEQGPLWGCDCEGVHKDAIDTEVHLHPAPGSHPDKWGPCSAVRGRTSFRFAPCLARISQVFQPPVLFKSTV